MPSPFASTLRMMVVTDAGVMAGPSKFLTKYCSSFFVTVPSLSTSHSLNARLSCLNWASVKRGISSSSDSSSFSACCVDWLGSLSCSSNYGICYGFLTLYSGSMISVCSVSLNDGYSVNCCFFGVFGACFGGYCGGGLLLEFSLSGFTMLLFVSSSLLCWFTWLLTFSCFFSGCCATTGSGSASRSFGIALSTSAKFCLGATGARLYSLSTSKFGSKSALTAARTNSLKSMTPSRFKSTE